MAYESLKNETNLEMQKRLEKKYKEMNILDESNKGKEKDWVFYDGPIYANARPGLHHVFAKTIKDTFCKYKNMQGYRVLRKIGLDTHGLPIEVNVEKKLGFKTKVDIENYGIDKFCEICKKETTANTDLVNEVTEKMGQFIDLDNPYITCSNDYIETEWWIIKQMHEKGLLYKGNKVLPYCPRCGTELSSHEVAQGYKEVSVNTVYVTFKVEELNAYAIVWTTTPWTLIANEALCVNPNEVYVKVKSKDVNFIVAKKLMEKVLGEECEILEEYKGKDLEGISYKQLMPFMNVPANALKIICADYVTMEDGTGIVHIAPAFGADDALASQKYNIDVVNPVNKEGKYTTGPWKDRLVTEPELELDIIKYLKEEDKLFRKEKINHNYPHCWRCKSPLIYYAKEAWYVKATEYKDKIIEENNKINWHPYYIGEKRFNNWLENMVDWGISRNRFWGAPLPVWTCECGNIHVIGSIDELKKCAIEDFDEKDIDLHRPFVDKLHIKCDKCNMQMSRVADVLDVWFDSGAMPYAQYHYPFENKELFESQFPADFIAEGVDQTRGWFYVLLVISTIISGKSSFKNVVVNDMMLDAEGKKMSKSVGNIVDPIDIINEYGADVVRSYLLYVSPVWTPLKFDVNGVKEINSKFINTLKNTYTFFELYANADNIDASKIKIDYESLEEIDKWLLSKLNKLVKEVRSYLDEYDLNKAMRKIVYFTNEDLSNWYIRRNRRRFWAKEMDESKKSVYKTTYDSLVTLTKLIAPFVPFISDEIYTKLTGETSVHLSNYPEFNESLINKEIENKMDLVRDLISTGRFVRDTAKIKVRQPLSECLIDGKYESIIGDLKTLITEELNVKNIVFIDDLSKYMKFTIKPNFKVVGSMFKSKIKEFTDALKDLNDDEVNSLLKEEIITIDFDGGRLDITKDMVDIKVNAKDGFDVGMQNNKFVILNTDLDRALLLEGLAREFISKIQNYRKSKGLEIENRIKLSYKSDEDIEKAIEKHKDYIMNEVLAVTLEKSSDIEDLLDVNGHEVYIKLVKE